MKKVIERILHYIEEHLDEKLSIKGLAKKFGLSESSLKYYFKRHSNMSVANYIKKRRVIRAAGDILFTDDPISVIADKRNFTDQKMLSKAFLHYFNMSPTEFRKKRPIWLLEDPPTSEELDRNYENNTHKRRRHRKNAKMISQLFKCLVLAQIKRVKINPEWIKQSYLLRLPQPLVINLPDGTREEIDGAVVDITLSAEDPEGLDTQVSYYSKNSKKLYFLESDDYEFGLTTPFLHLFTLGNPAVVYLINDFFARPFDQITWQKRKAISVSSNAQLLVTTQAKSKLLQSKLREVYEKNKPGDEMYLEDHLAFASMLRTFEPSDFHRFKCEYLPGRWKRNMRYDIGETETMAISMIIFIIVHGITEHLKDDLSLRFTPGSIFYLQTYLSFDMALSRLAEIDTPFDFGEGPWVFGDALQIIWDGCIRKIKPETMERNLARLMNKKLIFKIKPKFRKRGSS